jgi:hypothetical protein
MGFTTNPNRRYSLKSFKTLCEGHKVYILYKLRNARGPSMLTWHPILNNNNKKKNYILN